MKVFCIPSLKILRLNFELANCCAELKGRVYMGNKVKGVENGECLSVSDWRELWASGHDPCGSFGTILEEHRN